MAEYISREEAINTIKSLESSMPAKDNYAKGYDAALGRVLIAVREVPPVSDVQPVKHGRWKNEYLKDDDVWWADCTNCNNDTHSRFGRVSIYAYCPNCGAKMDAEPDEPWQSE